MRKTDFYDAAWERLVALKSYRLISVRNKTFRLTKRGIEFLKHEDKEYYLGKILLMDKYKRTKHPDIFIECFNQFVKLSARERKAIKKVVLSGYSDFGEISEDEWATWDRYIVKIYSKLGKKKSQELIRRICNSSLRNITIGVKAPVNIPVKTLRKILEELKEENTFNKEKLEKVENKSSFTVKNLLELHIEEIIRRNFKKLFPNLQIIDNGQHYYTNNGNYIDILCKNNNDNSYVVIELKRDRSPSRALIQLLDYMNQIMDEFKTKNVKGILICKNVDRRTRSALKAMRNKLKNPEDISIVEFNLKMGIRRIQ